MYLVKGLEMGHLGQFQGDSRGGVAWCCQGNQKKQSQGAAYLGPGFDQCCSVSRASKVMLMVKNLPANPRDVRYMGSILGWEDLLEKEMATHSSILAWRIP